MRKKEEYQPRKVLFGLLVLGLLVVYPYLRDFFGQPRDAQAPRNFEFGGATMGTYYRIKVAAPPLDEPRMREVADGIETLLQDINRQMSTYDPDSEISRFNRSAATGTPLVVSASFAQVASRALELARLTGGAFDPTIAPLVKTWGFTDTREQGDWQPPAPTTISQLMDAIGFEHLTLTNDALVKAHPDITLDLNAIAKGYAVDALAQHLQQAGCSNVFVEIGGEIVALGHSPDGKPWRVAIETPERDSGLASKPYFRTVALTNGAIATSGDYRNYFSREGVIYGHILDPRSGYPVSNGVASISVLAPDCMTADALATALAVLGPDAGLALVETLSATEALFIIPQPGGGFTNRTSSGFPQP